MAEYMRSKVGEILLEAGLITPEQLDSVLVEQKTIKKRIGRLLIDKGWLAEDQLLSTLGEQLNLPLVNLYNCKIDAEVANCISVEMARRHMIIPVESIGKQIVLAMADPLDLSALDDVAMVTGLDVAPVIAGESAIAHAINQFYGMRESSEYHNDGQGSVVREGENPRWPAVEVAEAPVVKIVNSLIHRAIEEGASDIHLEPTGEGLRIRMRLDGILHDLTSPPQYAQAHIIARVKIMADLDVAEKRLPQDGNIQVQHSRDGINLRVSTMPTIHGEKVVIRLLEKQKIILPLEGLGFSEKSYRTLSRLLLNRAGMILVAGPTGCGKTTTLYSALNFINHPEDNIITVEDPVEYHLE
ncbi:MAG TPA: ATPase, T2SS/T4P/T4SS family, partial [Candidatus Limnocylindrales bacterium]|nr:ATPase, T2SS/T4P/T4SS family [Candidatus Limnocylindrales bacterium]